MSDHTRKILLHVCCAPCAVCPTAELRSEGFSVTGFFSNDNIHPSQEYSRRKEAVETYSGIVSLDMIYCDYRFEEFLASVAAKPEARCGFCYTSRLEKTAEAAAVGGFPLFTSTLLYSKYQNHELIRELGEKAADRYGVGFLYRDFRTLWQEGIKVSKSLGLYRQQYCGCIYSEKERYMGTASKPQKKR
jgi:predicted adenine nucleotide alpha hydrolase (AANH) superfamily ATPase